MPSCSVKWCSNHTSTCSLKSKNGVSFHRFPKDETICNKWVEAVRFERRDPWWTSSNASRICSIHFKESDISSTPCKVNILAKTAVPVCTMVWSDDHENNVTLKTSIGSRNTDKTILKTYERKKTNMNVLKESKLNNSYYRNKEDSMSKTNRVVISNMSSCNSCYLPQDNIPEATKLIKTLQGSKTLNLRTSLEPNSIHNINLKTNANENVTAIQKKKLLIDVNKQEYVKSCTEKCCKSEILVKLNDNTNLVLDEDLSNDGNTIFMDSYKVSKNPNTMCEISKKVNLKELKTIENKEVNNKSNSDKIIETIINGNVGLDANISKSFVGKMLKTYLPKRKNKINEKNIRETCMNLNKNKDMWSSTSKKGLNTAKCNEVNNTYVHKNHKDDFSKKLNTEMYIKNNFKDELQSSKSLQEINKSRAFKNVKKYVFKRKSKLLTNRIKREHNKPTIGVEAKTDANKESNISNIDVFIINQPRIDKIKETDTAVYDEIISELFETSKNVSYTPSCSNYQETNENHMNSAFGKGTNTMNVILDLNTNGCRELNKDTQDLELYNANTALIDEINTEVNTNKTTIHESFMQFYKRTVIKSNQQLSIINKNIISESHPNLSTEMKEKVPDQDHYAGFDKNKDIVVNDLGKPLQSNNSTDATKQTESNATNSMHRVNAFTLEEFISNISAESNDSEIMDFNISLNTEANTTREPFNKLHIPNITTEYNKTHEKDMPDLNTVINLELCGERNIGCTDKINTELNTEKTDINADQYKENRANQLLIMNKNLPMEQSDRMISKSDSYLHSEMNRNNATQSNQNICNDENITYNTIMLYNNELKNLKTSVVKYIGNVTKKDKFTELKKHLSMKPKLDCTSELCTNILTDTDKNMFSKYDSIKVITEENLQVPDKDRNLELDENSNMDVNNINAKQNNINNITRETKSNVTSSIKFKSILDEELITNIEPESNYNDNILDNNNCKKILEMDMPEINTVILPEINEDEILNCKEVVNIKLYNLNEEMFIDNDLLLRKSDKDIVNVLAMPEDQHIDNKDLAAEFDLSLLLSDTPIPDEVIQNVDNSNYNSLDGIFGSPNWIQLPSGEIPKIIDDILDQDSQLFENLDLFDKVNKFKMDKEVSKKNVGDKEKYSTTSVEQFEKHEINNFCETGKKCVKKSIAEIEKRLIAEFYDCNEATLVQGNIKVSQSKKVTDKQILQQCLQTRNEECKNLNQIVDKCNEHKDKEIQGGNKTINQWEKQNEVDSKTNQVEDQSINQIFGPYCEQGEELQLTSNDEVLKDVDGFKLSKKQYAKQSTGQTNQTSNVKLTTTKEEIPKCKILNQSNLGSSFQETNKQLSKDFNGKRTEEINKVSREAHTAGTEGRSELNFGKLKRVIFEKCYDSECQNKCKHQKHNSNTELHEEDKQQHKKPTNYTPYDVPNESSINSSNIQLNVGSSDQNIQQIRTQSFLEHHKLSHNEKYRTKYKKIAIDHIPGQYLELRWKESLGKSNTISEEGCKRKKKDLGLDQRKILCSESTTISQQIMAECPECGYTTDDNDMMNYKSNVDLRITKPLSLINKDMLISLRDKAESNGNNNKVSLGTVYAMELAYVTAIQALERKLKQKIAISEYRLRKVNKLSKINNKLVKANITCMNFTHDNKF